MVETAGTGFPVEKAGNNRPGNPAPGLRFSDPRVPFALLLAAYCVLGWTVLGFNRNPLQTSITVGVCMLLDALFNRLLRGSWMFPLSAAISGMGIALLVNYSHDPFLPLLPAFFCVASKYLLTFEGRHCFNPNLCGVIGALMFGNGLYASAPAYQWGGGTAMTMLIIVGALLFFIRKVGRLPLVLAFIGFYVLQTLLRAWLMRWHLPVETIISGSLASPAFYLFAFYMITDPKTSPDSPRAQVLWALAIVSLDLYFHLRASLATQFFALFTLSAARWGFLHVRKLIREGWRWPRVGVWAVRLACFTALGATCFTAYATWIRPQWVALDPGFAFAKIPASQSGMDSRMGTALEEVDPRVRHIAKWVLSVGDAVAVADFDNDGLSDVFLTNPLKRPEDRNALYRNLGGFRFERVPLPALDALSRDPEKNGLVAGAMFFDYDNSGAQSLLLVTAFGKPILLKNRIIDIGRAEFADVSEKSGIDEYTISVAAAVFDYDNDGLPDILIGNVLNPWLPDYKAPTKLNLFRLPDAEYPGDRRPFHFMHHGWHNSENGGRNVLLHNLGGGRFARQDIAALGMPQTHWTLAIGTGDFNRDGYTDLYCANDFGPDDLYLNEAGKRFRRIQGSLYGSIGRDTYKGMNVSIGDLDNSGANDIYVSNVHVPLQAEGSLLWHVDPGDHSEDGHPRFTDTASNRGTVNESRFGWGAAMGDLNLDGGLDLTQANGMVDDTPDKRYASPRNYWYLAGYVMRSGPEVHSYADRWPDMRGYSIWGRQLDRVYLNRGAQARPQFVDVAAQTGLTEPGNSRGMALADFDNDGALDLVVTHQFRPADLYRNTLHDADRKSGRVHHWLGLTLLGDGKRVSREATGTRVLVTATLEGKRVTQSREVRMANGFSAQGDKRLLFGLGNWTGPVEVEIHWHGAETQRLVFQQADGYHSVSYRPTDEPLIADKNPHATMRQP